MSEINISITCNPKTLNKNIIGLIGNAYYEKTGDNNFDLDNFSVFLENIDVTRYLANDTTIGDFLYDVKERFDRIRGLTTQARRNIINIINRLNQKNKFNVLLTLKEKPGHKQPTSKKRRIDDNSSVVINYNKNELSVDEEKFLPFIFDDCVEFMKYIMKQHVFDKLHDTVYTRCVNGNTISPPFKILRPITPNQLRTVLCEIRKVLRSPLISIFTNFINHPDTTVEMGQQIIFWISSIFLVGDDFSVGDTKKKLIQNIQNLCDVLDDDITATSGNMEPNILGGDIEKIEERENIEIITGKSSTRLSDKNVTKSATCLVNNAMSVKKQYTENTKLVHSLTGHIDGATNDISAKFLHGAKNNDGTHLYTKCTPITFKMIWSGKPNDFYQEIKIELNKLSDGSDSGTVNITISLCIGGILESTVYENYDLFSKPTTNATYFNSDSIIDMITSFKNKTFNKETYNSTQHFGKALGDFLKNMDWFTIIAGEYVPFNQKSIADTSVVAVGATDRLSSAIAIELSTESRYKVDKTKVGKVVVTSKGHISIIVKLFLDKFENITQEEYKDVKSSYVIQSLSTVSQILPQGFVIDEATNINDGYCLFRSLLYSLEYRDNDNINAFKRELGSEVRYQIFHDELQSRFEGNTIGENIREYIKQLMEESYVGGFLEIQVFATLYNKSVIVHDYSEDTSEIHEFHPIPQLFKPGLKLSEYNTIHLYYDGSKYSRLIDNTQSGGSQLENDAIRTNIDLSSICDIDFVLSFNPLNPEHLERFENHKKAFDDFLLFLKNHDIENKIFINFMFDGKIYSFFTSTLKEAVIVNKITLQRNAMYMSLNNKKGMSIRKHKQRLLMRNSLISRTRPKSLRISRKKTVPVIKNRSKKRSRTFIIDNLKTLKKKPIIHNYTRKTGYSTEYNKNLLY